MRDNYYSSNWHQATQKFRDAAASVGYLRWCVVENHPFDIPYVKIGTGPRHLVINSGVHGLEGYFGSAAQLMFLREYVPRMTSRMLQNYTVSLIHVINGWGMQNRMREVRDSSGGLVDLNRNFGIDFAHPENLPQNPKYELAHDLLLSKPDPVAKTRAIRRFRRAHLDDGVWAAISFGQYTHPYGLFYGGAAPATENIMTMQIYDDILGPSATELTSIGMHTGLGRFWRRRGAVSAQLLVSHPVSHPNTRYFCDILPGTAVVGDENAANGPVLLGDLVDCIEARYAPRNIPVRTADFEIGTGEFPVMSPIYKRMDMGDARYDLLHHGRISAQTHDNLTESWYPSDTRWRVAALQRARVLFDDLMTMMQR